MNPPSIPFKERLRRGDLLVGTWIKTPSYIVTEVLATSELDVLCLDAEHAPFGRASLDACVLACYAHAMPVLIRLPSSKPSAILNALDIGATGIVAPHVTSATEAAQLVKVSLYGPGGRGYAGSSRAAHYTRKSMPQHIADSSAGTTIVAQIEDREGVENIEAIAAVADVDCLFVGRADLAIAYGADSASAPTVMAAAEHICVAATRASKTIGMFVPNLAELPRWRALGVSFFLLESDHTFLLRGAATLANNVRSATL